MTIRTRVAVAAEFLRNALAGEALAVPKLDAMAHAAGLLGERQHITQAKLFRRAKDALGIRSVREGFGAGGRWAWELPSSSDAPARIAATSQHQNPLSLASGSRELPGWSKISHSLTFHGTDGISSSKIAMRS
jgi:hypothetical protein